MKLSTTSFLLCAACASLCSGFGLSPRAATDSRAPWSAATAIVATTTTLLAEPPSTDMKPLYDGTNYTFPDTTNPAGIAELLEVSFVNACMQLRTGFVDVLKLFIAAAVGGYEYGFPIDDIERELERCPKQSAGRSLMPEEAALRRDWLSVVYLLLAQIGHPTKFEGDPADVVPESVRHTYGPAVDELATCHRTGGDVTVESLTADLPSDRSPMEHAVMSQTVRVAKLTLQVLREAEDARPGGATPPPQPPTPPIEGAF